MKKLFIIIIMIIIGGGAYYLGQHFSSNISHQGHKHKTLLGYWTCSMHPQIKQDKAGKCPICGMNLIHVKAGDDFETDSDSIKRDNSPLWQCKDYPDVTSSKEEICPIDGTPMIKVNRVPAAGKTVAKVKLRESQVEHFKADIFHAQPINMSKTLRLLGRVIQSEEKEANIPARIAGRVEKVYISSTGSFISKGDPVVDIYSPELIATGEEYLLARQAYQRNKTKEYKNLLEQAKQKLNLWGIQAFQYNSWYKNNKVPRNITLYSTANGIVRKKNAVAGKYFKQGQSFYDLVDLSKVWIEMDVYEHDSSLIKIGQSIEVEFSAYPGIKFNSEIDFISPLFNEATRTLNVRGTIDNHDAKLKPGMVGETYIHITLANKRLAVPRTAIIDTGKRKVIWCDLGENRYIAKTVTTGFESEGYVEIVDGLKENDGVVLEGNFLLDAQAQLFGGYTDTPNDNDSTNKNH